MAGKNKGLCARLEEGYPHIVAMRDISHLFNNVFKKSTKVIPLKIRNIFHDITTHFSQSTHKRALLRQIQFENNFPQLEILKDCPTRFLSMKDSLTRMLTIWPSLEKYFNEYGKSKEKN